MQKHEEKHPVSTDKISFSEKLGWLNKLLWGGSALLAMEHLWHGEISPFPPFLTAAADAQELTVVLHEMATSGVGMAVLVTAVWGVMCVVSDKIHLKQLVNQEQSDSTTEEVPV